MFTTSNKILVLGCGGRISSHPDESLPREEHAPIFESFLQGEIVPEYAGEGLQVDFVSVAHERNPGNLNPHIWEAVSDHIRKGRFGYDAFLVLHPRENSVEAANHVAFSTPGNLKPVIFLESDMHYGNVISNARRTLHAGIVVALRAPEAVPGVTIYTHDYKFISAFDAKYGYEERASDLRIYSRSGNIFAELHGLGLSTFVQDSIRESNRIRASAVCFGRQNICNTALNIIALDYTQPFYLGPNNLVINNSEISPDGVVLLSQAGGFKGMESVFRMLEDKSIPSVLIDALGKSDVASHVEPFSGFMNHIISGGTMSQETATAKLRFGLSQGFSGRELRTWMETPYLNDHPDPNDMVCVDERGFKPQASRGLITLEAA